MNKLNEIAIRRNNAILLENTYFKYTTADDYNTESLKLFVDYIASLEKMGYRLSVDGYLPVALNLVKLPSEELEVIVKDSLQAVTDLVGDKKFDVFYKNFPKETRDTDDFVLTFNALAHYLFGYIPEGIVDERDLSGEVEVDKSDLTALQFVEEDKYLMNLLNNLLSTPVALSETDMADLVSIVDYLKDYQLNYVLSNADIKFKEVLGTLVAHLKTEGRLDRLNLNTVIKTSTDLLRVVMYLKTGSSTIPKNARLKLSNPERRFVLNTLEGLSNPVEDMLRYKNIWRDIAKITHPKRSTHSKCVNYFDYVFDKKKYVSFNSSVDKLVADYTESKDLSNLVSLIGKLSERPSEFARRLDYLIRLSAVISKHHSKIVVVAFSEVASKVSSRVLLQVRNHFLNRNNGSVPRTVVLNGASVVLDKNTEVDASIVEKVLDVIDNSLKAQFIYKEELGKVYVDPELKNLAITTSERDASKQAKNPLTAGSRRLLKNNGVDNPIFRAFLLWKDIDTEEYAHMNTVDLDLSVSFYDEDFETVSECTYYNLKTKGDKHTYAYHSGDITSAPKGAAEYVDINVNKALDSGVRYLSMEVNSYSHQTFKELATARVGFMHLDKRDEMKGNIYNPKLVQSSNDLTSESTATTVCVLDLVTMEMTWVDKNTRNTKTSHALNNADSTRELTVPIVKKYINQDFTSLYDLYTLHADVRGELVESIDEADVVFNSHDFENPLDIADVVSNWVS